MSRNKKSNIVDDTIYLFDYKKRTFKKICQGPMKSGRVTSDIRLETSK
jgi:hypothetical protein